MKKTAPDAEDKLDYCAIDAERMKIILDNIVTGAGADILFIPQSAMPKPTDAQYIPQINSVCINMKQQYLLTAAETPMPQRSWAANTKQEM